MRCTEWNEITLRIDGAAANFGIPEVAAPARGPTLTGNACTVPTRSGKRSIGLVRRTLDSDAIQRPTVATKRPGV